MKHLYETLKQVVVPAFTVTGLEVRTQNVPGKADKDIGGLWERFISQEVGKKIKAKSEFFYALYSGYESDWTGCYNCLVGMDGEKGEGCISRQIPEQTYIVFEAKGELPQAVIETWQIIWEADKQLNRLYTYDFEKYLGPNEVDIYIAVN